jgi:hypothetical protein
MESLLDDGMGIYASGADALLAAWDGSLDRVGRRIAESGNSEYLAPGLAMLAANLLSRFGITRDQLVTELNLIAAEEDAYQDQP